MENPIKIKKRSGKYFDKSNIIPRVSNP